MTTREELEKLNPWDKILVNGHERIFIGLKPEGMMEPVVGLFPEGGSDSWDYSQVIIPKPKPKKLGRIYMCLDEVGPYIPGDLTTAITVEPAMASSEYWQPVTINDKGEVFEVQS